MKSSSSSSIMTTASSSFHVTASSMLLWWWMKIWLISNLLCGCYQLVQSDERNNGVVGGILRRTNQNQNNKRIFRDLQSSSTSSTATTSLCGEEDESTTTTTTTTIIEETKIIESYFIVDLVGFPLEVTQDDFNELSSYFVLAYNQVKLESISLGGEEEEEESSSCINVTDAEIIVSTTDEEQSSSSSQIIESSNERDFSVKMKVTAILYRTIIQQQPVESSNSTINTTTTNNVTESTNNNSTDNSANNNSTTDIDVVDTGTTNTTTTNTTNTNTTNDTDTTTIDDCVPNTNTTTTSVCEFPTRDDVRAEWKIQYYSSSNFVQGQNAITAISDLNELVVQPSCNPTNFTQFTTDIILTLNITTLPTLLSETNLQDISNIFRLSYMAVNELNSNICDPYFRRMIEILSTTTIEVSEDNTSSLQYGHLRNNNNNSSSSSIVYIQINVGGLCDGCNINDNDGNLFDSSSSMMTATTTSSTTQRQRRRARKLQETTTNNDTTANTLCLCPEDAVERGPTIREFYHEFVIATQDLPFVEDVVEVNEVNSFDCSDDIIEFNETVLLDINTICNSSDVILLEDDIRIIEEAFVQSYNELSESLCDPFIRILDNASLIRRSSIDDVGNNNSSSSSSDNNKVTTLELIVFGRCRGCNPDEDDGESSIIYSQIDGIMPPPIESLDSSARRRMLQGREVVDSTSSSKRRQQRRLETCYCDAMAGGGGGSTQDRPPTEPEHINFLSSYVMSEETTLSCVSSIPKCNFGTNFQTAIVASFPATETLSNDSLTTYALAMEVAFTRTISSFYKTTTQYCHREFRTFNSIDTTIDVPFQPRDFNLPIDDRRSRWLLEQQERIHTYQQQRILQEATIDPTFSPSFIPSSNPSSNPSSTPSVMPSSMPSFIDTDTYVLFYSNGICNGCQGLPVVSPTSDQSAPPFGGDVLESSTSQCSCPIDANEITGPYSAEDFERVFQNELNVENVPFTIRNIYETDVAECDRTESMQGFDSRLYVKFSFNTSLAANETRALTNLVEQTYQSLSTQYCDPLMRQLNSLRLESTSLLEFSSGGCSEFQLVYSASGECLGCGNGTVLLDDSSSDDMQQRTLLVRDDDYEFASRLKDTVTSPSLPPPPPPPPPPRRLQFDGDALCFCDQSTIASRAPNPKEFQTAITAALIGTPNLAKVCSVKVPSQTIEATAPTASPTEKVCNVTLPDQLSTRVLVTVQGPDDQDLSDVQKQKIGDTILTTYNSMIGLRFTPCDMEYRLVSNVTIDPEFASPSEASLAFVVDVDCQGCTPDSDLFDPTVITRPSFETVYTRNAQAGNFSVANVREIDIRSCPSDTIEFSRVLRIEFTQLPCMDGLNFTGTEPQLRSIEAAFVSSYNNLVLSYCDPFYRTLQQAEIVRFGENTDDGNLPVEIRVNGTCGGGCNSDTINVYSIPNSMLEARRLLEETTDLATTSRHLQDVVETCFCDSQAIGDRAPFESEFVAEYRKSVEALQLECIQSVGQCEFGTRFAAGILVFFDQDELLESGNITALVEDTFLRTINGIYEVDDETCNPEFRMIDDVQATIGVNLTMLGNMTGPIDGVLRSLQTATDFPTTSPTLFDNTTAPTASPVILPDGPTSAPTSAVVTGVAVLLYVAGTCNGCSNDLALSNQVVSSGRNRELQQVPPSFVSNSSCFCPLEASRKTEVAADEVTSSFQRSLDDEEVGLTVNEIDEITVVECIDEMRTYNSFFAFDFAVREGITNTEINAVLGLIETTYNELNMAYCDPLLRNITLALLAEDLPSDMSLRTQEDGCVRVDIEFQSRGHCRGCNEEFTELFDYDYLEDSRRRELNEFDLDLSTFSRGRRRGLQEFDVCYCEGATIASRSPTIDEFAAVFAPRLEALQLRSVCAFFGAAKENCDLEENGERYEGYVEISLVVEGDLSGGDVNDMEEIFFDTFNDEVDSFLEVCDEEYTQLLYVDVDDIYFEFENDEETCLTVEFFYIGLCQPDGPCDDEILDDVLDEIIYQIGRRVGPVTEASKDEAICDIIEIYDEYYYYDDDEYDYYDDDETGDSFDGEETDDYYYGEDSEGTDDYYYGGDDGDGEGDDYYYGGDDGDDGDGEGDDYYYGGDGDDDEIPEEDDDEVTGDDDGTDDYYYGGDDDVPADDDDEGGGDDDYYYRRLFL